MSNQYPPPPPPGGQDPNQPPPGGTPPPPPPPGAPGTQPPAYGGYTPPAPPPDQYGQPPAYPPPGAPGGYGPAEPKNNVLAIVSLVTGILGILCCGAGVFSIAALVCGFLGRKQVEESAGTQKGSGMAMAGIILGAVGLVIAVIYWILLAAGAINYNFSTSP